VGNALAEPLRAEGARGHGSAVVPADEALAHVALEASGRPLLVSNVDLSQARIAGLAGDLAARFLEEFAQAAGLTLHVRLVEGSPGVVRLAHDSDRHDDMAVALAMAAAHLLERPVHSGAAATSGGDSPDGFRSALLGDVSALADRSGKLDPSLSYGSEF